MLGGWGSEGPKGPTLGRHTSACATILACVTLVHALVYCNFLREVRIGGWGSEGPKGLTLGRHVSACATILRLHALLYLGCVHYYIACVTLVCALVYCNFLKEVRLGGRGSEGPKGPILGRHASACATILRLRALLYLRASH